VIKKIGRDSLPIFLSSVYEIEVASNPNPWTEDQIRLELDLPNSDLYCAFQSNKLVGFSIVRTYPPEAELLEIAVCKAFLNMGVGTLLINETLTSLKRIGIKTLHLEVRKNNQAAINLYRKFSFKEVGERKEYYKGPVEDSLLMTLEL